MTDQYKNDIDRIQKLLVSIKSDLNKREQRKKAGQQTTMIEGEIRGQLTSLGIVAKQIDRELTLLGDLIKAQEKNLLLKEQEKRRNQLQEFFNQRDQIKESFTIQSKQELTPLLKNDSQLAGMSNKELFANQKDLQAQQDRLLDQSNEQAVVLKHQGLSINQTLEQQNNALDKLNDDVDKTNKGMISTNSKLAKMIQKSNQCWLIIVIVIEIVTLILFLLFL